jgi:uncharacterized protein (TIGR00725 family)
MSGVFQICVSGAASGDTVEPAHQLAYDVGKFIGKSGHILLTGATIGLPHYAAKGAKSAGGMSIGFSPASSRREHVNSYGLPVKEFDYINFTGMDYVGRDVHLVQSSDAVITIGGRMGSMHEFSTAIESDKVCAVLLGTGGLADFIPTLIENITTPHASKIIYDTSPERIIQRVIEALNGRYAGFNDKLARDRDEKAGSNYRAERAG